ncbi:hypothetical protein [Rugamonas sp. DEMB1]|uniref:hypothetical protein n=1 Tax=Rugamonas sp. DEMB1 TaxID=3039386 RepID=UPI00244BF616|nr:hypothetical protein [Rugamonas sp. DEMB1]WGG50844.1 hypothetical protein QC826_00555 [Rugamonas sp. DEMB1]
MTVFGALGAADGVTAAVLLVATRASTARAGAAGGRVMVGSTCGVLSNGSGGTKVGACASATVFGGLLGLGGGGGGSAATKVTLTTCGRARTILCSVPVCSR